MIFGWRKKIQTSNETDVHKNTILGALGIERWQVPESHEEVENYPLYPPFSYCMIVRNKHTSENLYIIDELPMNIQERGVYQKLRNFLERELEAPKEGQSLREAFNEQVPIILENQKKDYNELGSVELNKILYYLERDIAGYGLIEPLMFDPNIEDISCTGFRKPLFLWHRKYENIRTIPGTFFIGSVVL